MADIVLATLNARYTHASMGLRYLRANLGVWREHSVIREFIIQSRPLDVVEKILADQPKVVGLGVYIWNIEETTKVVALLKTLRPEIVVVLGGPEVSYETAEQRIVQWADYVVTGWGETTLPKLLQQILVGPKPLQKIHVGEQAALDDIIMPYAEYTDEDVRHRTLYVEASRGCPFKCEFCLSALDKTAWPFELEPFLYEMETLYQRGVRLFKFVDRTFNLKPETGRKILDFFLEKIQQAPDDLVFVHFEVVPDHLPDILKEAIAKFPEGTLQFEIGIQTLDATTQKNISRRTDLTKAETNVRWLVEESNAHLHVDLIAGLPGETIETFASGFDRLWRWGADEIQLGILKRLRGTPIIRHTDAFGMRYNPEPPYNVLSTDAVSFTEMQTFTRFARYWDLVANSGRFTMTLPFIMQSHSSPYQSFSQLSAHIFETSGVTHNIALERLFALVYGYLSTTDSPRDTIEQVLKEDWLRAGMKGIPKFLPQNFPPPHKTPVAEKNHEKHSRPSRQTRHLV